MSGQRDGLGGLPLMVLCGFLVFFSLFYFDFAKFLQDAYIIFIIEEKKKKCSWSLVWVEALKKGQLSGKCRRTCLLPERPN